MLLIVAIFLLYLLLKNWQAFHSFTLFQWFLILVFPLVATLYTYQIPGLYFNKIRQVGWLKPFVVGFIWSGWVSVYPLLVWQVQTIHTNQTVAVPGGLFWLNNFLFISILAIIFDIKDYRNDVQLGLNTYPARLGIINTFRYVIYPVTAINIGVFLLLQWQQNFSFAQSLIQSIPYVLLIWVILTHRKPKKLLYYLVAIDGLMFLKAICGIISISFF